MWNLIIGFLSGAVKRWFEYRRKKTEIKQTLKLKEMEGEFDIPSMRGWKDEYLAIVISLPFVVVLVAAIFGNETIVKNVVQGVDTLQRLPDNWWNLMYIVVVGTFGLRGWRMVKESKAQNLNKKKSPRNEGTNKDEDGAETDNVP